MNRSRAPIYHGADPHARHAIGRSWENAIYFKMLPNWLGITKIMVLTYKRIEYLLKTSSANLFKLDRKQVANRTMDRSFIDYYPGWFLSLCKRVGGDEFSSRQFNKAL